MKKIRFANESEIEVADVSASGDTIRITVEGTGVDDISEIFKNNPSLTSRLLFIVGSDIIRGYAGYTDLEKIEYIPDVVKNVDYTIADNTTESGFAEEKADTIVVSMRKVDKVLQVAAAAEQIAANLDYVAMETGVEL